MPAELFFWRSQAGFDEAVRLAKAAVDCEKAAAKAGQIVEVAGVGVRRAVVRRAPPTRARPAAKPMQVPPNPKQVAAVIPKPGAPADAAKAAGGAPPKAPGGAVERLAKAGAIIPPKAPAPTPLAPTPGGAPAGGEDVESQAGEATPAGAGGTRGSRGQRGARNVSEGALGGAVGGCSNPALVASRQTACPSCEPWDIPSGSAGGCTASPSMAWGGVRGACVTDYWVRARGGASRACGASVGASTDGACEGASDGACDGRTNRPARGPSRRRSRGRLCGVRHGIYIMGPCAWASWPLERAARR